MKGEEMTYSTGEMLKLINTAATNILLKEKKVSFEARIRKQREELGYTQDFLARTRKKIEEMAPEVMEAEKRARESRELFALLKGQMDGVQKELHRLREIEKKAPLLRQMRAELPGLGESVAGLQERYDRILHIRNLKRARKEGIEPERNAMVTKLQAKKEKLAYLVNEYEQISARVSGYCSVDYVSRLHAKEISVSETLGERTVGREDSELPVSLIPFLKNARKVDVICRAIEGVDGEGDRSFSNMKAISDSGILSGMKDDIKRQADEFMSVERRKVEELGRRKSVVDGAEERLGGLKKEAARLEEELKGEQEFRERSQSMLKELDRERSGQEAELERLKKEADRLRKDRDFTNTLTAALKPSVEYLRNVNRRLSDRISAYQKTFRDVARVIKEDSGGQGAA